MSEDVVTVPGVLLWYRADRREGAVELEGGRFLRFVQTRLPHSDVGRGVSVTIDRHGKTAAKQIQVRAVPSATRVAIEDVPVERPRGAPQVRPDGAKRPPGMLVDTEGAAASAAGRKPRSLKRRYPKKREGEAFAQGASVHHPQWGQGFVVMATSRVARVRFSGQERGVRVADLRPLDDQ